MDRFGAAERELLETRAGELYDAAVVEPLTAPSHGGDSAERAAFDLLVDLGLLAEEEDGRFAAVDPANVQSNVVAPLGLRATQLLEEASEWSSTLEQFAKRYRSADSPRSAVRELHGIPTISRYLEVALDDAAEELLTAQPTIDRVAGIGQAAKRDLRTVERGVHMRTLYQHSARRSIAVREYVDTIQAHGAQVRTLDEFFQRLIVIDRRLAFIPGAEGTHVALAIRDPHLIAYLVDIFERYWERARPFDDRHEATTATIAADVRNMTIRMLAEGHSDPASAKRMGVSTRTYAGYISALKDEFNSQTRFQLGYAMGYEDCRQQEPEDPF